MNNSLAPLLIPVIAAVTNGVLLLWYNSKPLGVVRATLRCLAFLLFTAVIFHAHIAPTQAPDLTLSTGYRWLCAALQLSWWLLAASTVMLLVRLYFAIGDRTRTERFTLDVVETLVYLTAMAIIVRDVFDFPLKGVLATSGAVAIVLGLALQSTLADLFSGIVINATAPFRVGDQVVIDDGVEGVVREITWRATHMLKGNRDLVIVPNSVIAKSRITNTSALDGSHATIVTFQMVSSVRPSIVLTALKLAVESCIGIDQQLPVRSATKSVGWQAIDYEVTFFVKSGCDSDETKSIFFDAAHRHLEAIVAFEQTHHVLDDAHKPTFAHRLIEGVDIFGLLSLDEKNKLVGSMTVRELAPGEVLLHKGEVPAAISIVGCGVINAAALRAGMLVDVMRFSPREYFGESGPLAGIAVDAELSAKTYAVIFDIPAGIVADLVRSHPGMAQAMVAKLAERERRGQALMQVKHDRPMTQHGLFAWIHRTVTALHGLRI